jgi:tetratricopeptide (TPR) repeat protein
MVLKDLDKSIDAYEGLLRLYPDHYWGMKNLIYLYGQVGRIDLSAQLAVRMADLRPSDVELNAEAAWAKAIAENNLEGARPYLERVSSLLAAEGENPDTDQVSRAWLLQFPAFEDWLAGKLPEAHAELAAVESAKSLEPGELASFHMAFGELGAAESGCLRDRDPQESEQCLAIVAFAKGDLPAVKVHLLRAEAKPGLGIVAGSTASLLMVRVGLLTDAQRILRGATPRGDRLVEGEIALAHGETAKGVSLLEEGLDFRRTRASLPYFLASESLAQIYEKQSKLEDALRILHNASEQKARSYREPMVGGGMVAGYWLVTELETANVYRKMGRVAEAEKLEAGLLKMLAYADADHPILRELQKRRRLPFTG